MKQDSATERKGNKLKQKLKSSNKHIHALFLWRYKCDLLGQFRIFGMFETDGTYIYQYPTNGLTSVRDGTISVCTLRVLLFVVLLGSLLDQ